MIDSVASPRHVLGYSIKNQTEVLYHSIFNFPLIDGISGTQEHIIIFIIHSWKNVLCKKTIYKCIILIIGMLKKSKTFLERLLIKCYYGVIVVIIFVLVKLMKYRYIGFNIGPYM